MVREREREQICKVNKKETSREVERERVKVGDRKKENER